MPVNFGAGIRMVLDAQHRYARASLPCYLRVRNWLEGADNEDGTQGDFLEVGVPFAASGVAAVNTGIVDILIDPPPQIRSMSYHNLALFGQRLNFGSAIFLISHTFVLRQMRELNILDSTQVWRDRDGRKVIGLVHDNQLFGIASVNNRQVAGETVSWEILGNNLESAIAPVASP